MGTSQFSSGTEGYPNGMAEWFVAEARSSFKHMGCRSFVVFPEVATGAQWGPLVRGRGHSSS